MIALTPRDDCRCGSGYCARLNRTRCDPMRSRRQVRSRKMSHNRRRHREQRIFPTDLGRQSAYFPGTGCRAAAGIKSTLCEIVPLPRDWTIRRSMRNSAAPTSLVPAARAALPSSKRMLRRQANAACSIQSLTTTSRSTPDSAPHTSPGRPSNCRTDAPRLSLGKLSNVSVAGSNRWMALALKSVTHTLSLLST